MPNWPNRKLTADGVQLVITIWDLNHEYIYSHIWNPYRKQPNK